MDILLINPKELHARNYSTMPPLGLAFIGSMAEKNGFTVNILDLDIKPKNFDIYKYIKDSLPKIVGIGGTSHTRFESFKIAHIAKRVSDNVATVYGGCHAALTAEDTLSHIKDIDYIVHGEGELTFLDLASCIIFNKEDPENIKGISYTRDGKVMCNPFRERIRDLDAIPYSRHLLEMHAYNSRLDLLNIPSTSIMTSRGCPFNCSFCSTSIMFGGAYTMRSAKNVADEIDYCIDKFGIKGIRFCDSTFTINRNHVISLIEELRRRKIEIPWNCYIRADTVDLSLLEAMKEGGCYYVNLGVESASDRVLRYGIDKKINLEQVSNVLKWCKELKIKTRVLFSFGHIGETWEDTEQTFAFIEKHKDEITVLATAYGIRIYPGTRVERYAREKGLLPKDFSWSQSFKDIIKGPVVSTGIPFLLQPSYGLKELRRLYKLEIKRDIHSIRSTIDSLKKTKSLEDLLQKLWIFIKLVLSRN